MRESDVILVTGATGRVGGHVVSRLLEAGAPVRALVRDPASAALPSGAEVVAGDLADPASLDAALKGAGSVFLLWPTLSADHAAPATVGAIAGSARRIVYLSANGVPDDAPDDPSREPGGILGSHALIERLIARSGAEWTFLRPTGFAANTLGWASQIRDGGVVRAPFGRAARSLIHERDIAAVAARALTEDGHAGARHVITGPRAVTQIEQAHAIGEAIGRQVRFEEIPAGTAREQMLAAWGDASAVDGMLRGWARMAEEPEVVTAAVEEITGTPARTFREWAADHVADFDPRAGR
ncbi:NAD(P)H-binding protein [Planobispora takensis]|uniref:Nucleotide-diphosphate-sugar epimerase n=1 Tax=Planobispora takensis TaxID=1367882 RepID=A0A8J3SW72_9ACTN|nr:NAD(P)H-binding protein [Planobispora takensis]GII01363.1 nucleotide-diphosphate-sugar epimerase [Planobispora takensis]